MWKWVESSEETTPKTIDESNPSVVYVRKDIQRIVKKDTQSGTEIEMWGYYEQIVPKKDWKYFEELFIVENSTNENSVCIFDLADLSDENSASILDLADYISQLEERVSQLEGGNK